MLFEFCSSKFFQIKDFYGCSTVCLSQTSCFVSYMRYNFKHCFKTYQNKPNKTLKHNNKYVWIRIKMDNYSFIYFLFTTFVNMSRFIVFLCYITQDFILNRLFHRVILPAMKYRFDYKPQFQRLEDEMRKDFNWPPVSSDTSANKYISALSLEECVWDSESSDRNREVRMANSFSKLDTSV